jgi:hypothetical protein
VTARDALAEQERNVRAALVTALERLVAESQSALWDAQVGRTVSVNVLSYRVAAVKDWQEIAHALLRAAAR